MIFLPLKTPSEIADKMSPIVMGRMARKLKNWGTQRQFLENICSQDDLRSRIFGTFVVKFIAGLSLQGFSNIQEMV